MTGNVSSKVLLGPGVVLCADVDVDGDAVVAVVVVIGVHLLSTAVVDTEFCLEDVSS